GKGEWSYLQPKASRALHEWKKGGRIIEFLMREAVRAVVLVSYNDAGRFRILRWCRKHGVPCFAFGDSNICGDRATGIRAFVKRVALGWMTRNAAGILCCGRMGREFFGKYGAKPEKIGYFTNEPDYELIQRIQSAEIEQMRQRFELGRPRRRLLFAGR